MGHGIDTTQYSRGYTKEQILGPMCHVASKQPTEQLKSLDRRCMYIAILSISILTVSALGFMTGAVISGALLGGALVLATAALAFLALNMHERQSIKSQLTSNANCLESLISSFQEDQEITEKDTEDYTSQDYSIIKHQIQIDLDRGLKITYNEKTITNADKLEELCDKDKLILYNASQAMTSEPTFFVTKVMSEINPGVFPSGYNQKIDIINREGIKQLVSTLDHYMGNPNGYHYWCPLFTETTLDFSEMTRTVKLSTYLGSSGISAVPTK